ncbi:MAG: DNA polymerase III subunit delta [Bdellovibrionaceae bacterium]|nr:DNA polymerase III subunit delta [Pseudobdellovibrionaceae bacterium]
MSFDPRSFWQSLNTRIAPMYVLYGEEEFFINEALFLMERAVLGEMSRDFNYDSFYGKESSVSNIVDVAETLPMMAERRMVVVRDADKWTESDWSSFDNYLTRPSESTVLVFVMKSIDKRKKTHKRLLEAATAFEMKKPYDNQVPMWIQYIAKKWSCEIEPDAASLLHQFVGASLMEVNNEIQKLGQYLGPGKTVTSKDVISVVSNIKVQSVFDLSRAIGECDKALALLCLSQLLSHGQNEVGILALVSRHVRILRSVKTAKKEGIKGAQLASKVGVSPYFLTEYEQQARHWSDQKIEKTVRALLDVDRALKSSPISSHIWLENFVIQTCG